MLHTPVPSYPSRTLDSIERYAPLVIKLMVYALLCVLLYQAAVTFGSYQPGRPTPFMLSMLRTFIFLPLHEAGHLIFGFFGRMLSVLGGSFWQIMFPFAWFVVAARQRSVTSPFALFWVGENMMDVSLYMGDAPYRQLPLLGGHKSGHDWHNLFSMWNIMDSAETIADLVYYLGLLVALAAIGIGVFSALRSFLKPEPIAFPGADED